MKNLLLIIALLLIGCQKPENTDVSPRFNVDDSILNDSLKTHYWNEASRLALREIIDRGDESINSVLIPEDSIRKYYCGLVSVYNQSDLSARDSVTMIYSIITFPYPELFGFTMAVDTGSTISTSWLSGDSLTGNSVIDSLLIYYEFQFERAHVWPWGWCSGSYVSPRPLNLYALTDMIALQADILHANPWSWGGDWHDIIGTSFADHLTLEYFYKWGDCPAGCTAEHFWSFKIWHNGNVEYIGSGGDKLWNP